MNYILEKDWQNVIYYNFIKHLNLFLPNFV